ncbi:MAG: EutN/CcmL family microcompartment protein, partial [Planctomycetota bacterium]|nr:EutN/CcmL family microcompartment protein [Planctomycetota bacterium]
MQLAKVIGSANATVKHQSMVGWKLMLINVLSADGETPDGDPVLA